MNDLYSNIDNELFKFSVQHLREFSFIYKFALVSFRLKLIIFSEIFSAISKIFSEIIVAFFKGIYD